MSLAVGSLFSGIGGLDLGLERAGMTVKWQCELDPFCSQVLAKHWPGVPNLGDVTKVDWEGVERVDLICGGYPCQPFSLAGARRGEDDDRHLWPHFRDALGVLRPRFALLENVPGHLSLGFDRVLGDLADLGYDAEWDCIPAAAVGAPHLRYRVFVVARANRDGEPGVPVDAFSRRRVMAPDTRRVCDESRRGTGNVGSEKSAREGEASQRQRVRDAASDSSPVLADAECAERGSESEGWNVADGNHPRGEEAAGRTRADGEACGERLMADANRAGRQEQRRTFSGELRTRTQWREWWSVEPDVGRVAHGVPRRVDRLRALGNAVVPQVAQFVGEQILASGAAR